MCDGGDGVSESKHGWHAIYGDNPVPGDALVLLTQDGNGNRVNRVWRRGGQWAPVATPEEVVALEEAARSCGYDLAIDQVLDVLDNLASGHAGPMSDGQSLVAHKYTLHTVRRVNERDAALARAEAAEDDSRAMAIDLRISKEAAAKMSDETRALKDEVAVLRDALGKIANGPDGMMGTKCRWIALEALKAIGQEAP